MSERDNKPASTAEPDAAPTLTPVARPAPAAAASGSGKPVRVRFLKNHDYNGTLYRPARLEPRRTGTGRDAIPADEAVLPALDAENLVKLGIAEEVK